MLVMDVSLATRLGFRLEGGGAHSSRTIMLAELTDLLATVNDPGAPHENYRHAIESENCLAKRSSATRSRTYKHLAELYALDPDVLLFRALRYFWSRDTSREGRRDGAMVLRLQRRASERPSFEAGGKAHGSEGIGASAGKKKVVTRY